MVGGRLRLIWSTGIRKIVFVLTIDAPLMYIIHCCILYTVHYTIYIVFCTLRHITLFLTFVLWTSIWKFVYLTILYNTNCSITNWEAICVFYIRASPLSGSVLLLAIDAPLINAMQRSSSLYTLPIKAHMINQHPLGKLPSLPAPATDRPVFSAIFTLSSSSSSTAHSPQSWSCPIQVCVSGYFLMVPSSISAFSTHIEVGIKVFSTRTEPCQSLFPWYRTVSGFFHPSLQFSPQLSFPPCLLHAACIPH